MSGKVLAVLPVFYPKYASIVIHCQSADDNFIKTVLVNISGGHIVITLRCFILSVLAYKVPLKIQLAVAQSICSNRGLRIVTAVKQHCRNGLGASCLIGIFRQICYCRIVTCGTVSAIRLTPIGKFTRCIHIINGVDFLACHTIEHCYIFMRILIHMAIGFNIGSGRYTPVADIGDNGALIIHVKFTFCIGPVAYGAVRRLDKQLRLAILIHIIHDELIEVRTRRHLQTQVQSPQRSSVHLIHIENSRGRGSVGHS